VNAAAATGASAEAANATQAPLHGIRVVEVSNTFMVPYATLLMAQMGAEVVKVEEPGGDILRQVGDVTGTGAGPMFLNANRGKKSVVLDLRDETDHRRLEELVRQADVFVHNRTPAAALRLGIDYASLQPLNPRMIHCGASGYGSDGPYRDLPAYDDIIQAASGIAAVQTHDGPPQYVRTVMTDKATGLFVLAAVLAALVERGRSGLGQAVEVPMFESMISFLFLEQQGGAVYDPAQGPTGYARVNSPYRHPYCTADSLISVMLYTDLQWRSFFELVQRPDMVADPRFASIGARTANIDALYRFLEEELMTRSTDEWLRLLPPLRIPASRVNTVAELLTDPHVLATGLVRESQHPSAGTVRTVRLPISFLRTPPPEPGPAPLLDEHGGADQLFA
jgi:crotonobetainyl-CoA:carnitine CoA-transferase CaiB-like acyl-CoA transferase